MIVKTVSKLLKHPKNKTARNSESEIFSTEVVKTGSRG